MYVYGARKYNQSRACAEILRRIRLMMRGSSSARTIVVFGAFALFLRGLDTVAAETLVEGESLAIHVYLTL